MSYEFMEAVNSHLEEAKFRQEQEKLAASQAREEWLGILFLTGVLILLFLTAVLVI